MSEAGAAHRLLKESPHNEVGDLASFTQDHVQRLLQIIQGGGPGRAYALLGGRGSGKSSTIRALGQLASTSTGWGRWTVAGHRSPKSPWSPFDPSRCRPGGPELPVELLHWLFGLEAIRNALRPGRGGSCTGDETLREVLLQLQRAIYPAQLLRVEEGLAASSETLPQRLALMQSDRIDLHDKQKALLQRLHTAVGNGSHPLMLVDDLDMVHAGALSLLRWLTEVAQDAGWTVVVACDQETMIETIAADLAEEAPQLRSREARMQRARAIFHRRLPVALPLPAWPPEQRLRLFSAPQELFPLAGGLSGLGPSEQAELNRAWQEQLNLGRPNWLEGEARRRREASTRAEEARRRAAGRGADPRTENENPEWERPQPGADPGLPEGLKLSALLGEALPETPRKLVQLYNHLQIALDPKAPLSAGPPSARLLTRQEAAPLPEQDQPLGRGLDLLLYSLDARFPALELRRMWTLHPGWLEELLWAVKDKGRPGDRGLAPAWQPLLRRLSAEERAELEQLLSRLALALDHLRARVEESQRHLSALIYDSAVDEAQATALLGARPPEAQLLRLPLPEGDRPTPRLLLQAAPAVQDWLDRSGLRGAGNRHIAVWAPQTLLLWLGWSLRDTGALTALTQQGGQRTRLNGPDQTLERRRYPEALEILRQDQDQGEPGALMVVDLSAVTGEGLWGQFPPKLATIRARRLIRRSAEGALQQDDVEKVLRAVVGELSRIRDEQPLGIVHLACAGGLPMSLLIGQQLGAFEPIQLHQFDQQSGRYGPTFALGQAARAALIFHGDVPDSRPAEWLGELAPGRALRPRISANSRPSLADIQAARETVEGWLRDEQLLQQVDMQLAVWAPISLLLWMGWRLYRAPRLEVVTELRGEQQRMRGLGAPLLSRDQQPYQLLTLHRDDLPEGPGGEALMVIALSASVQASVWSQFPPERSALRLRRRLLREGGAFITEDQVPAILSDAVKAIEELRAERGLGTIHLGFAGPAALALLLGQQLHRLRPILVYEYDPAQARYLEAFPLDEARAEPLQRGPELDDL